MWWSSNTVTSDNVHIIQLGSNLFNDFSVEREPSLLGLVVNISEKISLLSLPEDWERVSTTDELMLVIELLDTVLVLDPLVPES